MVADINTHLLAAIEGVEYEIELIGDEAVVRNFSKDWDNFCRMLYAANRGEKGFTRRYERFLDSPTPLFSFPATPELKSAVLMANEYYDEHDDASEELDSRIQGLAEPEIRKALAAKF